MSLFACGSDNDSTNPTINTFVPSATLSVTLSGDQQVPALDSNTQTSATVEYNSTDNVLRIRVNTAPIANFSGARLMLGGVGEKGLLQFNIQNITGQNAELFTAVSTQQLDQLTSGQMYIEVLTSDNPNGDIRAQIVSSDVTVFGFALNSAQEVPIVKSSASGYGYVAYNSTNESLYLRVNTLGIDDATMAHIHTGRVGYNGPVLVGLTSTQDNTWETPANTQLSNADFTALSTGAHYLNVHSSTYPSGEIRGQIVPSEYKVLTYNLSGSQEVPYVKTMASGNAYTLLNTVNYNFETTVVTSGVEEAVAAHIHTARVGENGPVLVGLEQSMDNQNVWSTPANTQIDADILAVLLSGGHYINVHTPTVPSGEIRGQIIADNYTLATFMINGKQEVPAVKTNAWGSGYTLINEDDYGLELRIYTEGVDDAVMAHIHTGRIGTNGGVLVGLEQNEDNAQVWSTPANTTIDADTLAQLLSAGHYVNVHTPAVPSGEIRGQILTDYYSISTFNLNGMQEVPALVTDAKGDGYTLINNDMNSLELRVVTSGVDSAVAAHIHTGRVGYNGPVLVGLEQSATDVNVWATPENTVLDNDTLSILLSGGHYVNVHTPTVASGEIRGQIINGQYKLFTFSLDGEQEVPAVSSMAKGDGYALVNTYNYAFELNILTEGVSNAVAAHVHTGTIGTNGPVLVGLQQSEGDPNRWYTPMNTTLDMDVLEVLLNAGHYVNVHTPAVPSGEIRGQILSNEHWLYTFPLSGDQQVPVVMTDADGDGYAVVNRYTFDLDVVVITRGVEDATAAHIHIGDAGTNGGVLAGLTQTMDDANIWKSSEALTIDADILSVLANSGHYVNIHTPAHPGGEIRGQIE